jgi:hypothetical protein
MMTDLIVEGKSILEAEKEQILYSLDSLDSNCRELVTMNNIEEVVNRMHQASLFATGAERLRMQEYVTKARRKEIILARAAGEILVKVSKGSGHKANINLDDLGISTQHASKWRRIAQLPKYAFERQLKRSTQPSINLMLTEVSRYNHLKAAVTAVDGDKNLLKRFISEGYNPLQAEAELSGNDDDDLDVFENDEDEDNDIDFSIDFGRAMEGFSTLAAEMETAADSMKSLFLETKQIIKEEYQQGLDSLKGIKGAVKELIDIFKEGQHLIQIKKPKGRAK